MRNQNFGVEIEMTGITREEAADVLAKYFSSRAHYEGGGYSKYTVRDTKSRTWQVMSDASIVRQKKVNGRVVAADSNYSVEVVTPILQYEDITDLQEVVRQLRHKGAFVNDRCGIHIHVGAEKHTPATLRNALNLMMQKEDILYKALEIDSARMGYCRKVNENLIKLINTKKPKTFQQLSDLWYKDTHEDRNTHYNSTRYHGLNLHATFTKRTIEFRLFNSTLHAGEVKTYIQLCLAISHQALTQKKASSRRTVSDNEKYSMRCWLLRLGLIG